MSTVWKDTCGYAKHQRCSLGIYSMIVLSSSYDIIMDYAINPPVHVKNVFDGHNETNKFYLKE